LLKKRQFVQHFVPVGSVEHTEYAEHESDRENDEGDNLMEQSFKMTNKFISYMKPEHWQQHPCFLPETTQQGQ